jgi:thioredoxin-related protein
MRSPEIIVYSNPDCCLCDQVKAQIKKLQELHNFVWREINIVDDPAAFERFQYEIPVVFIDGFKAFKYHLDERRFVRLLESAARRRRAEASSAPRS